MNMANAARERIPTGGVRPSMRRAPLPRLSPRRYASAEHPLESITGASRGQQGTCNTRFALSRKASRRDGYEAHHQFCDEFGRRAA